MMLKTENLSSNRALRILLATNGLILFAGAMLGPVYAIFVEDIGGNLFDASIAIGLFALVAGITTMISGNYGDKIEENELIIIFGYITMGIGFFLHIFVNSIIFLFVVQIIIGLGEAIYSPVFDSVYSKHTDKRKSFCKQWGAWEAMDYFTTAIGAIIGGLIVTKLGFNTMFTLMSALCLASSVYIYILPRRLL